jgi:periplasmic protein TonB
LAISLVAHFVLLWPSTPAWRSTAVALPLLATLRPVLPPVTDATRPAMDIPAIVPSHRVPKSTEQKAYSRPTRVLAIDAPELLTPTRTDTDSTPSDPSRSSTVPSGSKTPVLSPAPATVASSLAVSEGVDPDGLRNYRLALAREARRYKRYPPQAIEAGWAGTVELRVSVRIGNATQTAELTKASGYPVLDEAALEMVRRALPATPLPAALQGQTFAIGLPVVFELPE